MCCGMGPGSLVTGNGAWRTARPAKTECVYAGPSESVSLGRNAMRVGWAPLASKLPHASHAPPTASIRELRLKAANRKAEREL